MSSHNDEWFASLRALEIDLLIISSSLPCKGFTLGLGLVVTLAQFLDAIVSCKVDRAGPIWVEDELTRFAE